MVVGVKGQRQFNGVEGVVVECIMGADEDVGSEGTEKVPPTRDPANMVSLCD